MNAITQTEAATLSTLEAADPTKNLILLPLSQLLPRRSKRNARACPSTSWPRAFPALACCKTLSSSLPPMTSITRWWPATAA